MKTLLRMTAAAVVAVACSLPSPQPLSAQDPEPTEKFAGQWQVIVRPRGGFLAPKWQYAEGRSLPKRPTAGIEVLMRPAFSWYGGRLLLERTAEWSEGPGTKVFSRPQDQGIQSYQSVIADFILYPTWSLDALPYLFAGGGFRTFAAEDSEAIAFPLPFFAGERRAALHAGVGFEVPVKKFLAQPGDRRLLRRHHELRQGARPSHEPDRRLHGVRRTVQEALPGSVRGAPAAGGRAAVATAEGRTPRRGPGLSPARGAVAA